MSKYFDWFLMGLFGGMGLCLAMALLKIIASFLGHAEPLHIGN